MANPPSEGAYGYGTAQLLPAELYNEILWILRHDLYATDDLAESADRRQFLIAARKDLFSVAQTCRSFYQPALDSLWEELDSLVPLLSLLCPAIRLDRLPDGSISPIISYTMVQPVQPEQWLAFDRHRARVRVLNSCEYTLSPTIFDSLMRFRPESVPVLPNARKIVWARYSSSGSLTNFLCPSLRALHIGHAVGLQYMERNRDLRALEHVLQVLAGRAPALQSLKLNNQEVFGRSLDCLSQCSNLANLVLLDPLNDDCLSSLSHMSQLKSISLCVPVPDMHERSSWVVLHNLESVTFRRSPVDCVTAVLKRLETPRLAHFTLDSESGYKNEASLIELRELFSALACSYQTLKTVHLFGVYSTAHTLAFMQPLLKCHEIAKFDFRQIYVTTERDDEVEAFAEAWPRIEELLLCAPVNPRSVIVLAVKCPNLRRLQFLDINLATVPSLESIAHIRPHGLERLHTEHVSAVDLESSARFLERLFPSIAKVFYGNEDGAVELYPFLLRMMRDREDAEFLLESAQADVYLEEDSE